MNLRRFAFLFAMLWLSLPIRAEGPAEVVVNYYAALGSGAEARALAMLSSANPIAAKHVRNDLVRNCVEVRSLRIESVDIAGDRARVDVIAHVFRRRLVRGRDSEELERRQFDLRLVEGVWRIQALPYVEELLVERIVAEPERAREIIAATPEMVGPQLVAELIRRSIIDANRKYDGRPPRFLTDLAYDIALAIDDRAGLSSALAAQAQEEIRAGKTDVASLRPRLQRAVSLAEEVESYDELAGSARAIALTYMSVDDSSREAERILRQALSYRDAITRDRVAALLSDLGLILFTRASYAAAYQTVSEALVLQEADRIEHAMAYNLVLLGRIFENQNDYELAIDYFRRATQYPTLKPSLIMARLGMARANFMLARYELAEQEAARALEIAQATPYRGLVSQGYVLNAELQVLRGKSAEAEKTLELAIAYARERDYAVAESQALLTLGNVYFREGRHAESLQAAKDAIAVFAEADFPGTDLHDGLLLAARSEIALGHEDRAIALLNDAIDAVETGRISVAGNERQRLLFFEPRQAAYTEMVRLLAARGAAEEALSYAERGKGRVLLDSLGRESTEDEGLVTAEEREKRERLLGQLQNVNRRVIALRAKNPVDRARLEREIARQKQAQLALDVLESHLHASKPHGPPARGMPTIVTRFPTQRDLTIVEFVVHEHSTTLFVIRDGVRSYEIDVARAELRDRVREYADLLTGRSLRHKNSAKTLYELLIAPMAAELKGGAVLCIVPDDVLWTLPFESLIGPDNRYLVERTAMFYVPSISAYRAIEQRRRSRTNPAHPLVAFGNPSIGEVRGSVSSVHRGADLASLPDAEIEARSIAAVWGRRSAVYTKSDAREDVAKREMQRARIVHFAAHGLFDDANPMYSQIVLAGNPAANEDGVLQAWEMMRLDLAADLVVLSACETARGRFGAGEGLIGMSWALFVGGCPSTVAARWKIASAKTTKLMVAFHRALSSSDESSFAKAKALRHAQLLLIREKLDPFYWASFVLVGAPD